MILLSIWLVPAIISLICLFIAIVIQKMTGFNRFNVIVLALLSFAPVMNMFLAAIGMIQVLISSRFYPKIEEWSDSASSWLTKPINKD
jgi:hypothetical protein